MAKRNNSEFIDLKALLRQYRKNWYWFIISIVVCGGLAFVYTKLRQQPYAVMANLLITPSDGEGTNPMESFSSMFGSKGQVDDEIFIVSSHSLYYKVAKDLDLNVSHTVRRNILRKNFMFEDFPVSVRTTAEMYDTLGTTISFRLKINEKGKADIRAKKDRKLLGEVKDVTLPYTIKIPYGEFTFFTTEDYIPGQSLNTDINVSGYHATAEMLNEMVSADIASKLSNVIQLRIETPYQNYGKAILNKIIQLYNERGIQESASNHELTAQFLDARLEVLAHDLNLAEEAVQKYKENNNIIDVSTETGYQSARRARIDEEIIRAEMAQNIVSMIKDFIDNPENEFKMIPTLGLSDKVSGGFSATISSPIINYNGLISRRIELMRSAKPGNRQLQILEDQIRAQRTNLIASINQAQAEAHQTMSDLENVMDNTQSFLSTVPNREREFANLQRQNILKQNLYVYLLQRREEVGMLIAKAIPKGQIIDQAYTLKEPLGARKMIIWLMGLFFGAVLVPVVLYIRQLIRNSFESRQDVERLISTPILGEICTDKSGETLVMTANPSGPAAELFRLMRSNLLFIMNDPSDKVIMVTSATSGEGKSFISINLAATIAMMGKRVLLIGMDVRNPKLAQYLHINNQMGLTQYLSSADIPLERIISPLKEVKGLDVIPAGPVPPNPSELLLSNRVDELFAKLRAMYDYIVIDSAPVGMVSDTFSLNRVADACIFVCRANHTTNTDLQQVDEISEQKRLKKISVVVNGTEPKQTYGYGQTNS